MQLGSARSCQPRRCCANLRSGPSAKHFSGFDATWTLKPLPVASGPTQETHSTYAVVRHACLGAPANVNDSHLIVSVPRPVTCCRAPACLCTSGAHTRMCLLQNVRQTSRPCPCVRRPAEHDSLRAAALTTAGYKLARGRCPRSALRRELTTRRLKSWSRAATPLGRRGNMHGQGAAEPRP